MTYESDAQADERINLMNPQDEPLDENTPIYPTEADRQCLRLSQKLYAKELELQIQLTTIETLKALLAANKL